MTSCPVCHKGRANLLVLADHVEKDHKDKKNAFVLRRRYKANAWKRRRAILQKQRARAGAAGSRNFTRPTSPVHIVPTIYGAGGPKPTAGRSMTTKEQAIQAIAQLHREAQEAVVRYALMLRELRGTV